MKALHYYLLIIVAMLFLGARCESEKNVPKPESDEPEYVDPTAGFTEIGVCDMEKNIPKEESYPTVFYNYFCFCNASDHYIQFEMQSKFGFTNGYMEPGTKFSTLLVNELFGTYDEGLIESIYSIRRFEIMYDDKRSPFVYTPEGIYEFYYEFDKNDYSGTFGDESKWIKERFTDRRVRWVYIFTNEDYERAKKISEERTDAPEWGWMDDLS